MNELMKRGGFFPPMSRDISSLLNPLFDELFNQVVRGLPVPMKPLGTYSYPKTDAYTEGNDFIVEAIVPFVKKEDLYVELDGRTLSITGETCIGADNDDRRYALKELRRSKFVRKFTLSQDLVDSISDVNVSLEEGILKVVFKDVVRAGKEEAVPTAKNLPIDSTTKLK